MALYRQGDGGWQVIDAPRLGNTALKETYAEAIAPKARQGFLRTKDEQRGVGVYVP